MTGAEDLKITFCGTMAAFFADTTRYVDLEGAFRAGKTTAGLWKVLKSCLDHPGIQWLICRYGDKDTQSKLKPNWRDICADAGVHLTWHADAEYDELDNGSNVYIFGLKAQDQVSRYAKLRGIGKGGLAGILVDQAEELPHDVYLEMAGRLSQKGYPHQILLTPNPPDEGHWLAREFPTDNHDAEHKYYSVSIYDNEHNLPPETIPGLVRAYPPGHIKHRSAVLGRRGLNVIGDPVYGPLDATQPKTAAFHRDLHERPLELNPNLPLYEGLDFGKHHPCVVWAQYTPYAELHVLGGILGQNLHLEDFAPIVQQYRQLWFPDALEVATCCDPAGSHEGTGLKHNAIEILRDLGFAVTFQTDSNQAHVRYAMVERIAGYMRRRTPNGEAFGIEKDRARWLRINALGAFEDGFMADGLEAGIVWDKIEVSSGGKKVRRIKGDGWYEHGHCCLTYIEHNFGGVQPTWESAMRRAERKRNREDVKTRRDYDPADQRFAPVRTRRGGY